MSISPMAIFVYMATQHKQPLTVAYEGSETAWDNFRKFIDQFQLKTQTLIRKLERIFNEL